MFTVGRNIDDMWRSEAALMVYGICRERYGEQAFSDLVSELDMIDLRERDPVEAQRRLNAKFGVGL